VHTCSILYQRLC